MKTLITLITSLVLLSGCSSNQSEWTETTVAAGNASRSTVAVDRSNGIVYVAWTGTENAVSNIYLARLKRGEAAFSTPVRVNSNPGNASVGAQAPPQVVVSPNGFVYVAWIKQTRVEGRRFPASDIYVARSKDGGRTFAPGVTVAANKPSFPTGQNFHDIAVGPEGDVYVSWLDSRAGDQPSETESGQSKNVTAHNISAHNMPDGSEMQHMHHAGESKMQIRVARSTDNAKSFAPGKVVSRRTCECCRTGLTVGDDGRIYVVWRQIFDTQIRDIAIARSLNDGKDFTSPERVHRDNWQIEACPHAGPSVVADNGQIYVFWFTGAPGKAGVYMAKAKEGGLDFGKPVMLPGASATSQVEADANENGALWFVWENYNKGKVKIGNDMKGSIDSSFATIKNARLPSIAATNNVAAVTWLAGDSVKARIYKF